MSLKIMERTMMNKCQECGHDCHCNEECGYVDWCGCENCNCETEEWPDNPVDGHQL